MQAYDILKGHIWNGTKLVSDCTCALQNRDAFQGTETLAKQLTTENLSVAHGKRVVVIGSAKSALDVAGAAGEVAESVTMLCRQVSLCQDMRKLKSVNAQLVAVLQQPAMCHVKNVVSRLSA